MTEEVEETKPSDEKSDGESDDAKTVRAEVPRKTITLPLEVWRRLSILKANRADTGLANTVTYLLDLQKD